MKFGIANLKKKIPFPHLCAIHVTNSKSISDTHQKQLTLYYISPIRIVMFDVQYFFQLL